MRMHNDWINLKARHKSFICHICRKGCKNEMTAVESFTCTLLLNQKLKKRQSSAKKRLSLYNFLIKESDFHKLKKMVLLFFFLPAFSIASLMTTEPNLVTGTDANPLRKEVIGVRT